MDKKIIREVRKGVPLIGICGGYQMLGNDIFDSGIEGGSGNVSIKGLGLLDVSTRFDEYRKETKQVEKTITGKGRILGPVNGEKVSGYEIHMGKTSGGDHAFGDDGCENENGLVFGTYLHGLFENDNIRDSFLHYLYERKGVQYKNEKQGDGIEELARFIETHVNMEMIYKKLEER